MFIWTSLALPLAQQASRSCVVMHCFQASIASPYIVCENQRKALVCSSAVCEPQSSLDELFCPLFPPPPLALKGPKLNPPPPEDELEPYGAVREH